MCFWVTLLVLKGIKSWILLHTVFISRDVHFHESIFPFQSHSLSQHLDPFEFISSPIIPTSAESNGMFVFPTFVDSVSLPTMPSTLQPESVVNPTADIAPAQSPGDCFEPLDCLTSPPDISPREIVLQVPNSPSIQLRKSTKQHKPPSYLQDYSCNLLTYKPPSGSAYDIAHHLSYANISVSHQSFSLAASAEVEPEFFHQAVSSKAWQVAMDKEISTLEPNHTWDIVPLLPGKCPIGCK